jgi:hypothetical protein
MSTIRTDSVPTIHNIRNRALATANTSMKKVSTQHTFADSAPEMESNLHQASMNSHKHNSEKICKDAPAKPLS